jgi:hypothetical protein
MFNLNDLTVQQLIFNLGGEHTLLCIMALHTTKKTVFQYVNTGQCRNTSTQIQMNVKMSNT